jgi:hypothetical protein
VKKNLWTRKKVNSEKAEKLKKIKFGQSSDSEEEEKLNFK